VFVQSHHPEGAPVARVPRHARHKVPEGEVVTELTPAAYGRLPQRQERV
jgi:hypothetical protein